MSVVVKVRFRRSDRDPWTHIDVTVGEPIDVLNIANRHFGDPTKNIGGPKLPALERWAKQ
jgi:hypothetical protein